MIFGQIKDIETKTLHQQIDLVSKDIQLLCDDIDKDSETTRFFQQVNIQKEEVIGNLMAHAKIVKNISAGLEDNQKKINLLIVDQLITYLTNWFKHYYDCKASSTPQEQVSKAIDLEGKVKCLEEFIDRALTYQNDIAAFPLQSQPKYTHCYRRIQVVECPDPQTTREHYQFLRKAILVTNAAVITELSQSNSLLGTISFGLSYPRFWIDQKEAELRNNIFLRKPKLEHLLPIWNLLENGALSSLKYLHYPYIHTNRMIYVPLEEKDYDSADICIPSPNSVPVRVISNRPIVFWKEQNKCCSCSHAGSVVFEKVILHAHGGGFVALSSDTMQNYTRRWSKSLDVPVLSVDYRKPPNYTFPTPVFDLFAVYKFLVSHELNRHCNIKVKHLVLAGDSAGSNLVLSTTALAMKINLPKPQGIFLAYPATDLRSNYTPSRILCFTDPILHPSLLLLCLRQYLGSQQRQVESHPLASPLLLSQAFVRGDANDKGWPNKWPPTRIVVGELDPLVDDSLKLLEKMVQSKVDVTCTIYRQLGHGFLSVKNVIHYAEKPLQDSIQMLRGLLKEVPV